MSTKHVVPQTTCGEGRHAGQKWKCKHMCVGCKDGAVSYIHVGIDKEGANKMTHDADTHNKPVVVASNLTAAFQNLSRATMIQTIAKQDCQMAVVYSRVYTGAVQHKAVVFCLPADSPQQTHRLLKMCWVAPNMGWTTMRRSMATSSTFSWPNTDIACCVC